MGRKQKGGSFQVWMRKTMYDNLTGNKVGKKQKGGFYKWINDLHKKRERGGYNNLTQKGGFAKGVEKWVRKNTTKKQQKDMDRWIVKNL